MIGATFGSRRAGVGGTDRLLPRWSRSPRVAVAGVRYAHQPHLDGALADVRSVPADLPQAVVSDRSTRPTWRRSASFSFLALAGATLHFQCSPTVASSAWSAARPSSAVWPNSLHIFCLGIVLSVLGHFVLSDIDDGARHAARRVNLVGLAVMIATARPHAMVQDGRPASAARRPPAHPTFGVADVSRHALLLRPRAGRHLCHRPRLPAVAADERDCTVPHEIVLFDDPKLKLTGEKLRAKQPITIVAIGGASDRGDRGRKRRRVQLPPPARGSAAPAPAGGSRSP